MANNEALGEALAKLEAEVVADEGPHRVVHYLDYVRERKSESDKVQTFVTGMNQLDSMVEGFRTGEVVVITGPTGNGKTLFADSLGQRLMRVEKMPIAWFSYEVPTVKVVQKYVVADDSKQLGLYVPMELKAGDLEWIKRKCLEAKLKYGVRAVFIDHLHFIIDMATQMNQSLNIGGVMRQLKHEVAKGMNLIVFVLAHQGQDKEGEPSISNIRDSSFIAQEADTVFVVWRTADPVPPELEQNAKLKNYQFTYDKGYATVKIDKARHAGTFRKKIVFQKREYWLEEV